MLYMLLSSNAVLIGYVVYDAVNVVYYVLRNCIGTSIHAVVFECSEPLPHSVPHGLADQKTKSCYYNAEHAVFTTKNVVICRTCSICYKKTKCATKN